MKVISHDEIVKKNIDPYSCYQWVSDAVARKDEVLCPAKISIKPDIPGVFYNTMPSIIPYLNVGGIKLVTRYPDRIPSLDSQILLYELSKGENIALIDGNWITAMRTGAVAAHSIDILAVKNFSTIGYIGLGNTARASLLVLLAIYPTRKFVIKLKKYKNQHEEFIERFKSYNNIEFYCYDHVEDVIDNSDVIISAATVFETDICADKYFKKGVTVVPIHTRGFTNCDLFFDKVFADDYNHVKNFKYFNEFRSFAQISDVVNNIKRGRDTDDERILVYNIGISMFDIYFAYQIYNKCSDDCHDICLNAPKEKFWV